MIIAAIPSDYKGKTDPHCTIAYLAEGTALDSVLPVVESSAQFFEPFTAKVSGQAHLGEDKVPVLLIESADLQAIRDNLKGFATDSFPSWVPHVSVSYEPNGDHGDVPETIHFDKLAIMDGDDSYEFPMSGNVSFGAREEAMVLLYNKNHDNLGRFASTPGFEAVEAGKRYVSEMHESTLKVGGETFNLRVGSRIVENDLNTKGIIETADGRHVGEFDRNFVMENGKPVVYHSYMEIAPEFQGKGIGTALLSKAIESYKRNGITAINVLAAGQADTQGMKVNGAYTWAKAGFHYRNQQSAQDHLYDMVRRNTNLGNDGPLYAMQKKVETDRWDEVTPAHIAALPGGKELLIQGADWFGRMDLDSVTASGALEFFNKNHDQLGRFTHAVQSSLDDSLRRAPWKGSENCYAGHCYVASEAMYHMLGGKDAGWKPMFVKHEGAPHWFLKGPKGEIVDPTAAQFHSPVPYDQAKGKGFLTAQPSRRAQTVIDRSMKLLGESQATTMATVQPLEFFNKYHDELGRFTAGPAGMKSAAEGQMVKTSIPPGKRGLEMAAAMYEHKFSNGYSTRITEKELAYDEKSADVDAMYIVGEILTPTGAKCGDFTRVVRINVPKQTAVVEHDYMSLNQYEQGKGIGKEFMDKQFEAYKANGISKVYVYAADTQEGRIGPYAWAKAGFRFENHGRAKEMLDRALQVAEQKDRPEVIPQIKALLHRADERHEVEPIHIAAIGWTPGAKTWFGKEILTGQLKTRNMKGTEFNWGGVFNIDYAQTASARIESVSLIAEVEEFYNKYHDKQGRFASAPDTSFHTIMGSDIQSALEGGRVVPAGAPALVRERLDHVLASMSSEDRAYIADNIKRAYESEEDMAPTWARRDLLMNLGLKGDTFIGDVDKKFAEAGLGWEHLAVFEATRHWNSGTSSATSIGLMQSAVRSIGASDEGLADFQKHLSDTIHPDTMALVSKRPRLDSHSLDIIVKTNYDVTQKWFADKFPGMEYVYVHRGVTKSNLEKGDLFMVNPLSSFTLSKEVAKGFRDDGYQKDRPLAISTHVPVKDIASLAELTGFGDVYEHEVVVRGRILQAEQISRFLD